MKKLDQNQKIGLISGAIFVVFLIGFSVLSSLVQGAIIPDFTPSQRVQGILVFFMFLPLLIAMFFAGKHFKSKNSKIGGQLTFISIALFVFGILQALLGLLGAYGS
ncbi:MAG: hypothetical protein IKA44_01820 [Clostridia bacterium]|nr:hypothetical protein [Clostridia bacterium]